MIRQPIVTLAGHIDHGKTSILDKLRGSSLAKEEAGGITQKISFTLFPSENIKKGCYLIDKYNVALEIPGFLFIDTPGHAAFTNLRKRGGGLADLAILVIDINEGIMPQTSEVIQILKANKTPFLIALNKIDCISGWHKQSEDLRESIEKQAMHTKEYFDEKLFTIMGSLHSHSFEADLFYNVSDFTKRITLVPCSAKTGEGIPELLMVLCGLSQKFLRKRLSLAQDAKGVILEIKREKAMQHIEAILYDGILKINDKIAIASFDKTTITRIRALHEIQPLSVQFKPVKEAKAATGLRIQISEKADILPGMPFVIFKENIEEIEKAFKKELSETIKTDKQGIIVKADSLGSLEALLTLLKQEKILVSRVGIGSINKSDIISAEANLETQPLNSVILGFNVKIDEEAKSLIKTKETKLLINDVIYHLIEDLKLWQEEKAKEIERQKLLALACICKIEILHNCIFRNSKPAIFGIKILAGKLRPGAQLMDSNGKEIDKVKNIQSENQSIQEASIASEVAISLPNTNFERQLSEKAILYSDLTESQFREFKKNKELLGSEELKILQEIAEIKRKEKIAWGV